MPKAILVTHGEIGAELIRASAKIFGPQTGIDALSNANLSVDDLAQRVRTELGSADEPIYLLVDLIGGSCSHACLMVAKEESRVRVVTGINLPMFLEFLHYRDRCPAEELIERLLSRGKDGIRCL